MSIYDNVKDVKDLLVLVKTNGMSTDTEDICRVQDIFGRTPLDELIAIARDNGRMNDKNEPDPDGSWSSGRDGYQSIFFSVLFKIWNWEDATRFYNEHVNKQYADLKKAVKDQEEKLKVANINIESITAQKEIAVKNAGSLLGKVSEQETIITDLENVNKEQAQVILELKAKLYDFMTKGGA